MKSLRIHIVLALLLTQAVSFGQVFPNFGSERVGLSTMSYLKNDASPRALGMAGTSIAFKGDAYSAFINPAALIDIKSLSIEASNLAVGAGVNQSFVSGIIKDNKHESAFGISINSLNSGAMDVRTEFQPYGTGEKFYVTYLSTGLTYSKKLSNLFSFGLTLKYLYEGLADYTNHAAAADFGFLYNTDYKNLKFAVVVQNFGGNSSLSGDFLETDFNRSSSVDLDNATVPTVFKLGFSLIPFDTERQSIRTGFQLDHPNDNAENYRFGVEYEYLDLLFIRTGYRFNLKGQQFPTFGFGVRTRIGAHPLFIDYGANPTNFLGIQHLVGFSFYLNKEKRDAENN